MLVEPAAPVKKVVAPPKVKPRSNADDLERAELDRIFKRLDASRSFVVQSAENVVRAHGWTTKTTFERIPGLRYLPLSRRLLEGYAARESLVTILSSVRRGVNAPLIEMSEEEAEAILNEEFKNEMLSFSAVMARLDTGSDDDTLIALEFLQHDPMRSRTYDLGSTLAAYPWGALLRRSFELAAREAAALCADEIQ